MTEQDGPDFNRMVAELRQASAEARQAAAKDPANSEDLQRKALQLERAAQRIEADGSRRDRFLVANEER
jgi:hypothetical protein